MGKTRKKICNMRNITLKQLKKQVVLKKNFNIFDCRYEKPTRADLAVGIVYFNCIKSKRLLMNYLYVVEKLKIANIPVFTLEMFEEHPEIKDAFHYKTNFILFQKERLCFLLEKHIPKHFTKLVFMDSDLILDNSNWYNELSHKLDFFDVIQPFSKALWLDITYTKIVKQRPSIVFFKKFNILNNTFGNGGYHPGYMWGFRREWFNNVGFFQYAVLGGGDSFSMIGFLNSHPLLFFKEYFTQLKCMYSSLHQYLLSFKNNTPRICNLDSNIFHLWHGSPTKRAYVSRWNILKSISDIRHILSIGSNGLFVLKYNPTLMKQIKMYFLNRQDDSL